MPRRPERQGRRKPRVGQEVASALGILIASAGVIFALGLVVGLLLVGRHGGGPIQSVDDATGSWLLGHRGPFVETSKLIATYLDALPLGIIAATVSVAMFVRIRSLVAGIPFAAYLGGEFEVFALREVIHRPRPLTANFPHFGSIAGVHETSYSFPSGHAVAVTAVVFSLASLVASTRHAWWPVVTAVVVALLVADSRLILGVHWLSDVVAGLIIGVAWGLVVTKTLCKLESRLRDLPV